MYDTGLADRIRAMGVPVVEIGGWQTRGSSLFKPRGAVNHHTAGAATGVVPSLNICIYGRTGLPGPLCHVLLGRDLRAYVIAAGIANHAGAGGWRGLAGNSTVHGLEIEHTGFGPSPDQLVVATKIHAAFLQGSSGDPDLVCQHFEWAPTRKIDFRELYPPFSAGSFRAAIAALLSGQTPSPILKDDDDMPYLIASRFTGVSFHDGAGSTWISDSATVTELRRQNVPVFTLDANESDARRIVSERAASTDEAILEQEKQQTDSARAQTLYLAAIQQIEAREEERDLAAGGG